ncbi:MAG TPA: molybdopterin-binding protein, partial [Bacillota bacterium]|nr:molybdopterin-binding protein [Bacillota bacterium]
MITEIIFTGTELLLGQILNTNAQYLQQALASLGFDLYHQVTVGDNLERCAEAIRQAAARADLIFIGGGLGPTGDDISREALGMALGLPLVQDPAALAIVRRFYLARN